MKPTRIAQASREYASSRGSRGRDFSNPFLERATGRADAARQVREAPVRRAVRRGSAKTSSTAAFTTRCHWSRSAPSDKAASSAASRAAAAAFETTRGSSKRLRFVSRRGRDRDRDRFPGERLGDRDRRRGSAVS